MTWPGKLVPKKGRLVLFVVSATPVEAVARDHASGGYVCSGCGIRVQRERDVRTRHGKRHAGALLAPLSENTVSALDPCPNLD